MICFCGAHVYLVKAGATRLVKINQLAGNSVGGNSLLNQPKPAAYKSKSGGILEVLEKMEEEAQV